MTDTATRAEHGDSPELDGSTRALASGGVDTTGDETASYEWAPNEPQPKKSRRALWIGIPAIAAVVGLVASSLVLIAPGTSVAGVGVGGMTAGAAADAIEARLAATTLVLTGDAGDIEVTGAELGASVDAEAIAEAAFAEHPMWNPTTWFASPVDVPVSIDEATATEALRAAAPSLYVDPVDAGVSFDAGTAAFVVAPAQPGQGIDLATVRDGLQDAFASGEARLELDAQVAPIEAAATTAAADTAAGRLNGALDTAGFYVGTERTVPVDRAVAASWITVGTDDDGAFTVDVDEAAIQSVVDALPAAVNRAPQSGTVITDSYGGVLREESVGISGRELGDTSGVAGDFAAQLETGDGAFVLPVTEVAPVITTLARRIEVNLSEQRTYLFENGQEVQSWAISSGKDGFSSGTGDFRITAKLTSQNMGNRDLTQFPNYFTPDVPWVMYYNGDEALHGTYWHSNFGNEMSHGCINMPVGAAEYVFGWAPMGTEVSVRY